MINSENFKRYKKYIKQNKINLWLITSLSLTITAFGILYLLKCDFYLFIILIYF